MKVILLEKVPGLGDIDDVKEVSDGYALNHLFPRHLAVQASAQKAAQLKAKEKKIAKDAEKELHEVQSLADRLDGYSLTIEDKVNEDNILYAAVTDQRIAQALKTYGFPVNKNMIITEPIKEVGDYKIKIKFYFMGRTKYIFVVGGVMSGVGKGITVASIGRILGNHGLKVSAIKIDPYINVDAGTMNPIEHGEVFVTDDGDETDQDIGNYERFLDTNILSTNYMTTGRVYQSVIEKERTMQFKGKCVQVVPHIPFEVLGRIEKQ